jgi:hypothetical protein
MFIVCKYGMRMAKLEFMMAQVINYTLTAGERQVKVLGIIRLQVTHQEQVGLVEDILAHPVAAQVLIIPLGEELQAGWVAHQLAVVI